MIVGVPKETAPGERRVALVPEVIGRLTKVGLEVLIESGAGESASLMDQQYLDAGATVVSAQDLYGRADVLLKVQKPSQEETARLRQGQAVIGLLQPLIDPQTAERISVRGATAISLDALPRTLSRAQTMDALSSQANVGGYKAVLIAANAFGRYFPLLTTAAGTAKPANVLVLGVGVAGLQAIATARRLGAVVRAYDVRGETREQAESLGATFLVLKSVADASGAGGYARELTGEERQAQQQELNEHIGGMDVVITTAQVPGRRPPLLVTAAAIERMKPGSVIVDMAASALGGNVEVSQPGEVVVTPNGVTIHAPTNLPAEMPTGASIFYARNIAALLLHFVKEGQMNYDFNDEIVSATVIAHEGRVVHEATANLLSPTDGTTDRPTPQASASPAQSTSGQASPAQSTSGQASPAQSTSGQASPAQSTGQPASAPTSDPSTGART
ncbi:Re/Si-specific NAD(P)(+) transhydrogenase subunit alpha [soil metagenome]